MIKTISALVAMVFLCFANGRPAYAAKIDISEQDVEKRICVDAYLCKLHGLLKEADDFASAYSQKVFEDDEAEEKEEKRQKSLVIAWEEKRDACRDTECIKKLYESRILESACIQVGSGIGSSYCSHVELILLDHDLDIREAQIARTIGSKDTFYPEYMEEVFTNEAKAWRSYRMTYCELEGAMEGGDLVWKNAFSIICVISETKKRLNRLRGW